LRVLYCRRSTTRILAGVVVVFVVCWTPWNIHSLIAEFHLESAGGSHFKFVDLLLKAFAVGSAVVNPFLYCWLNVNFRYPLYTRTAYTAFSPVEAQRRKISGVTKHGLVQGSLRAPAVGVRGCTVRRQKFFENFGGQNPAFCFVLGIRNLC